MFVAKSTCDFSSADIFYPRNIASTQTWFSISHVRSSVCRMKTIVFISIQFTSPIQTWPSCCFFVPSAARVRFQNRLKSRDVCAAKMLRIEIMELLNASDKSSHVLCIDKKLRSVWVEWRSYHICRCSRTYILKNKIHQLHNVFLLRTETTLHKN